MGKTMKRASRRSRLLALALGLPVVLALLLTTRLGVWVFLDVLGAFDEQAISIDAATGPVSAAPFTGSISSVEMPPGIEQPSGIAFDPRTRTWAISTDQAELFVLDTSMTRVLSRKLLLRTLPLLRQGQLEAVAFVPGNGPEEDRLAFTGETGTLEMWRRESGGSPGWVSDASIPLGGELAELEASALTFDPSTEEFLIASSDSPILYGVDLNGAVVGRLDLNNDDLWPTEAIRPERRIDELLISGLTLVEGRLWAVSQNYTMLFRLDPSSGRVTGLWSLPGLGEASDLAIVEGSAVFTLDHNWNDPRPAFRRLDVPAS